MNQLPLTMDARTVTIKSALKVFYLYLKTRSTSGATQPATHLQNLGKELKSLMELVGIYFLFEYKELVESNKATSCLLSKGFFPLKPDVQLFNDIYDVAVRKNGLISWKDGLWQSLSAAGGWTEARGRVTERRSELFGVEESRGRRYLAASTSSHQNFGGVGKKQLPYLKLL